MGRTELRGGQIKDESIDSADLASGSVKAAELNPQSISGQTLVTSTDTTNDRLLLWDATDSGLKQISIGNLGVTASPAGSDGQVQYNNDGASGGAAAFYWDDANNRVGIGTSGPDRKLDILDAASPQLRLTHTDGSKYVDFACNDNGDLQITGSAANAHLRFISPGNAGVVIQSDAVDGDAQLGFSVDAGSSLAFSVGVDDGDLDKFKIGTSTIDTNTSLTIDSTGKIGINTTTPKVKLDVMGNPTGLPDDTGGGNSVTFGTGATTAGKLYYLNGTAWAEINAADIANGADCLLAIALGTAPADDGMLIRGFFDATTYLTSFSAGKAVYMSETAANMTTTAPTALGAFVRIVGYCTTTANVIYFNPSSTWIEL